MAVVQISRIQIRRGQKNTSSGLPQLASGELAWAVDTQELYIGNGAVSEGAPSVGNTKILTEQDNLLELVGSYQFAKNNSAIQTGPNANQPIVQNLQDVIDQFVTSSNFGVIADAVYDDQTNTWSGTDNTVAIQRAIDQLYLNPAAYEAGKGAYIDARTELLFGPGAFLISGTIYLPSYVFLTGSGREHTTFAYTGDSVAFKFVNARSSIGEYTVEDMTETNQPKYAILRDFSITCESDLASGLELNAVSDSRFENLNINGSYPWDSQSYTVGNSTAKTGLVLLGGLNLAQQPTVATTSRNVFNSVNINNFAVSVRCDSNVSYNNFVNCSFSHAFYGIIIGYTAGLPLNNLVTNSVFKYVNREGIYLYKGTGNIFSKNKFYDVGNDGGHNTNNRYSIVYLGTAGNQSVNNSFDRAAILSVADFDSTYKPEVDGIAYFVNGEVQQTALSNAPSYIPAIRVPITSSGSFKIFYKYQSQDEVYQFRSGTMYITSTTITDPNTQIKTNHFEFVDEYDIVYGGTNPEALSFRGRISADKTAFIVDYQNTIPAGGILTFVVTALT